MVRLFVWLLFSVVLLEAREYREDFERVALGALPKGWVVDATDSRGRLAKWEVRSDSLRPKGTRHVLALTKPTQSSYNLCYNPSISFKNGTIAVRFRANSGRIDQGGGIAWRILDANNYYVARYNPLEDNFRFYHVIDGVRTMICTKEGIRLHKGWHTMRITHKVHRFSGYLDGAKLLECKDGTINSSGAVGVWTKADAATSFDDLEVDPR